jgi:hypothetical protein
VLTSGLVEEEDQATTRKATTAAAPAGQARSDTGPQDLGSDSHMGTQQRSFVLRAFSPLIMEYAPL